MSGWLKFFFFINFKNFLLPIERLDTPKDQLWNVVIDDRFVIQYRLGKGYTGSVYSGKFNYTFKYESINAFFMIQFDNFNFKIHQLGIDLETDKKVAIKFATEETIYSIELEYDNYIQLGALGIYFDWFKKKKNDCNSIKICQQIRILLNMAFRI